MGKKRSGGRKRELPITGILAGIVLILLIGLGVLVGLTQKNESRQKEEQRKKQTESATELLTAAETESEQAQTGKAETELESETAVKEETESESGQDLLVTKETETESETEPESEQLVVAIDPGHQGNWVDMSEKEPNGPGSSEMKAKATTGTQGSFSGKAEYELNLEISLLLRDELEKRGYRVILTREDNDTAISNAERAQMAYEEDGDIYVRIHANGSDDAGVQGALAMVPSSNNPVYS